VPVSTADVVLAASTEVEAPKDTEPGVSEPVVETSASPEPTEGETVPLGGEAEAGAAAGGSSSATEARKDASRKKKGKGKRR
jgi:hypothetical protein